MVSLLMLPFGFNSGYVTCSLSVIRVHPTVNSDQEPDLNTLLTKSQNFYSCMRKVCQCQPKRFENYKYFFK